LIDGARFRRDLEMLAENRFTIGVAPN